MQNECIIILQLSRLNLEQTTFDRFKLFRKTVNASASELGELLGVHRNAIYSYEKNVQVPNDKLDVLKEKYRLNVDWYRFGTTPMIQFDANEEALIPGLPVISDLLNNILHRLPNTDRHLVSALKAEIITLQQSSSKDEMMELLKRIDSNIKKL